MSREEGKLEYITHDLKRKVSFRKRRGCIIKKVHELSILCGVEAGAIVYSNPSDPQPEVWPNPKRVQQVIERYQTRPILERTLNQDGSIQKRIDKGKELLNKRCKENHGEEISQLMIHCMAGQTIPNIADWTDTKMVVQQSMKNINWMIGASLVPAISKEAQVLKDNEMLTDQFQQFGIGTNKETEVYVSTPQTSKGLFFNVENDKLIDQDLQYDRGIGNMEGYKCIGAYEMQHPFSNANYPYILAPPTSEGLFINVENEKLTDQQLQYGMNIGNMEDYIGIDEYEMPQHFSNANYPYVSSSYHPFSL